MLSLIRAKGQELIQEMALFAHCWVSEGQKSRGGEMFHRIFKM